MRLTKLAIVLPVVFATAACGSDEDAAVGRWEAEGLSETQFVLTEDGDFNLKTAQTGTCTGDWARDGEVIEANCIFASGPSVSTRVRLRDEGAGPSLLVGDDATDPESEETRFRRVEP